MDDLKEQNEEIKQAQDKAKATEEQIISLEAKICKNRAALQDPEFKAVLSGAATGDKTADAVIFDFCPDLADIEDFTP